MRTNAPYIPNTRIKDLSGLTFGHLKVLRFLRLVPHGENRAALFECQCRCGKIIARKGHVFTSGHTRSCGCWKRDRELSLIPTRNRRHLLAIAKCRANKLGREFELTLEDIVVPEVCPLLGIKLEWGVGKGRHRLDATPSVDRILPDKGYTKENVWIISWRANMLKNNATLEELKRLVKGLEEKIPQ